MPTGVSVKMMGFLCWLGSPTVGVQSVECNKISTLLLVQRDLCYPTNKIFLLGYDIWTNTS